jgi:hypothetical protein
MSVRVNPSENVLLYAQKKKEMMERARELKEERKRESPKGNYPSNSVVPKIENRDPLLIQNGIRI